MSHFIKTDYVALHQMNETARTMAREITLLTKKCDPKNLVIMCGEYHCQVAHRYFTVALTAHLDRSIGLDGYLHELPYQYQNELDAYAELAQTCQNLYTVGRSFAGAVRYNYSQMMPLVCVAAQHIPVHFMDMPDWKDVDQNNYVDPLDEKLLDSDLLRNLVNPYDLFMQHGHHVAASRSPVGLERRDLYMTHRLHEIQKEKPVVMLNGKGHLSDGKRETLANMLIRSGKEIVMLDLGVDGCTDKPDTDFLKNVAYEKRESVIALYCPIFPQVDAKKGITEGAAQWRDLDEKNRAVTSSSRTLLKNG